MVQQEGTTFSPPPIPSRSTPGEWAQEPEWPRQQQLSSSDGTQQIVQPTPLATANLNGGASAGFLSSSDPQPPQPRSVAAMSPGNILPDAFESYLRQNSSPLSRGTQQNSLPPPRGPHTQGNSALDSFASGSDLLTKSADPALRHGGTTRTIPRTTSTPPLTKQTQQLPHTVPSLSRTEVGDSAPPAPLVSSNLGAPLHPHTRPHPYPSREFVHELLTKEELQNRVRSLAALQDTADEERRAAVEATARGRAEVAQLQGELIKEGGDVRRKEQEIGDLEREFEAIQANIRRLQESAASIEQPSGGDRASIRGTVQKLQRDVAALEESVTFEADRIAEEEELVKREQEAEAELSRLIIERSDRVASIAASSSPPQREAEIIQMLHELRELEASSRIAKSSKAAEMKSEDEAAEEASRRLGELSITLDTLRSDIARTETYRTELSHAVQTKDEFLLTLQVELEQAKRQLDAASAQYRLAHAAYHKEAIDASRPAPIRSNTSSVPATDEVGASGERAGEKEADGIAKEMQKFEDRRFLRVAFVKLPSSGDRARGGVKYRYGTMDVSLSLKRLPEALSAPSADGLLGDEGIVSMNEPSLLLVHFGAGHVMPIADFVSAYEERELDRVLQPPPVFKSSSSSTTPTSRKFHCSVLAAKQSPIPDGGVGDAAGTGRFPGSTLRGGTHLEASPEAQLSPPLEPSASLFVRDGGNGGGAPYKGEGGETSWVSFGQNGEGAMPTDQSH